MKIFFKTRKAMRNSKIKGRKVDLGTYAEKRWAIVIDSLAK